MYTKFSMYILRFIKNKPGVNLYAQYRQCIQTLSWSEKSNEVNNDFKHRFHVDIHIYIKYSTRITGDKHW